ncbi:tyrosine phosphatase C-terminal region family protein [Rhodococcus sp. MTM3W5.2]|uniref:tyrosine-protein phosphatase n=1 Tax=Rhodococcus sp. MTM3W5.2 TaxID=1805827 RepID=UPI00097967E8|nr:tyrosine-protein phosphatase [Rhodococcus sp. MTM3W5.2]AQA21825.1 tyrosine phosphatase C-terminal region family protein [Rhodococcus sp. MTM3W5.2]
MDLSSMLEVTHNARGLEGLPLVGGGAVRAGVLYRSYALSSLTPMGVEQLVSLGIGTVVDLRTEGERHRAPDVLPADGSVRLISLPVEGGAMDELVQQLLPSDGRSRSLTHDQIQSIVDRVPALSDLYVTILENSAAAFATAARSIVTPTDRSRQGVLFHCTAGKDRTGLVSAILLMLADVERRAIVEDYMRTGENLAGPFAEQLLGLITSLGIPAVPRLRALATESPVDAIETAMDWLDRVHGGAAGYLRAGGLSDAEIESVRTQLRDAVDPVTMKPDELIPAGG